VLLEEGTLLERRSIGKEKFDLDALIGKSGQQQGQSLFFLVGSVNLVWEAD
jgi:hypothetical protein